MEANRITKAAAEIAEVIEGGGLNGALSTPAKLKKFETNNAVEAWESAKYRDINALAFAQGVLTLDEANIVYNALGREGFPQGNGGWSKGTSLALKVTITMLMAQLIA